MKKKYNKNLFQLCVYLVIMMLNTNYFAQVGVNILTPNSTAALQIESPVGTTKGLLTPSMTSSQRASIYTGAVIPADGLIVYDVNHHMHYSYNSARNAWVSLSPLTLTTAAISTTPYPNGVITTPSSSATFFFGINKQSPVQALDVVGNAAVSGNISSNNLTINNNATVAGSTTVNGTLNVAGFPSNALVPAGVITMFSGALIPKGWGICDGGIYNGLQTPDLRGRFVIGMDNTPGPANGNGQYIALATSGQTPTTASSDGTTVNYGSIGNKGGEIGHTLSLAEMPSHTHSVTATIINDHVFGFNNGAIKWIGSGVANQGQTQNVGVTISETSKGSDQIHENRPPYYVLVYIIKLP